VVPAASASAASAEEGNEGDSDGGRIERDGYASSAGVEVGAGTAVGRRRRGLRAPLAHTPIENASMAEGIGEERGGGGANDRSGTRRRSAGRSGGRYGGLESEASVLHHLIRRGNWDGLRARAVSENSDEAGGGVNGALLTPNSIGWTALHFAASHGAPDSERWKWIIGAVLRAAMEREVTEAADEVQAQAGEDGNISGDSSIRDGKRSSSREASLPTTAAAAAAGRSSAAHLSVLHMTLDDRAALTPPGGRTPPTRLEEYVALAGALDRLSRPSQAAGALVDDNHGDGSEGRKGAQQRDEEGDTNGSDNRKPSPQPASPAMATISLEENLFGEIPVGELARASRARPCRHCHRRCRKRCPSPFSLRTEAGHAPIDLFFLRALHPLPWQRPEVHGAATELRESIFMFTGSAANDGALDRLREGIRRRMEEERERQRWEEREEREEDDLGQQRNEASQGTTSSHISPPSTIAAFSTTGASGESESAVPISAQAYNSGSDAGGTAGTVENGTHHDGSNENTDGDNNNVLVEFWHRMELLLMAGRYGTLDIGRVDPSPADPSDEESSSDISASCIPTDRRWRGRGPRRWRVLHALAETGCPSEIASLALRLYPSQISEPDERGDLPLHVAAGSRTGCGFPEAGSATSRAVASGDNAGGGGEVDPTTGQARGLAQSFASSSPFLSALLAHCPHLAGVPDGRGRLPLNLALSAGATWDDAGGGEGVARAILEACPGVVYGGARDSGTGLAPFMLAAADRRQGGFQRRRRRDGGADMEAKAMDAENAAEERGDAKPFSCGCRFNHAHPSPNYSLCDDSSSSSSSIGGFDDDGATEEEFRAKRSASATIGGMWRFLPDGARERALEEARREVDIAKLNTVFELLRAAPDAVGCGIAC